MPAAVWLIFAVTAMLGIFVACVLVVAAGVRVLEGALARSRRKTVA